MRPTRRVLLPLLLLPLSARADVFSLGALMERLSGVAERQARFREERTLGALTQPLVSTGRLLYRRPDYLAKDTLWPLRERLVINGSRMIVTDPASNDPPHVVDLTGQPELRVLLESMRAPLAGDLAALRRSFTLELSGGWAEWSLVLSPSGPSAKLLSSVRIVGRDDWVTTIRVVQVNGDESLLQIAPA